MRVDFFGFVFVYVVKVQSRFSLWLCEVNWIGGTQQKSPALIQPI